MTGIYLRAATGLAVRKLVEGRDAARLERAWSDVG
jgi:hypothetical protein